jgi:hypothetical protein
LNPANDILNRYIAFEGKNIQLISENLSGHGIDVSSITEKFIVWAKGVWAAPKRQPSGRVPSV